MGRKDLTIERREQIVSAFLACACRDGLKSATNRKIADEAGVQNSIIYHYFNDRTEMVEALVDKVTDIIVSKIHNSFSPSMNIEEKVNGLVDFLFDLVADDPMATLLYDLWSEARRNETIRKSFEMMYERFKDAGVIQLEASGYGVMFSNEEKRALGTLIAAIQDGLMVQHDMAKHRVNVPLVRELTRDMLMSFFKRRKEQYHGMQIAEE